MLVSSAWGRAGESAAGQRAGGRLPSPALLTPDEAPARSISAPSPNVGRPLPAAALPHLDHWVFSAASLRVSSGGGCIGLSARTTWAQQCPSARPSASLSGSTAQVHVSVPAVLPSGPPRRCHPAPGLGPRPTNRAREFGWDLPTVPQEGLGHNAAPRIGTGTSGLGRRPVLGGSWPGCASPAAGLGQALERQGPLLLFPQGRY